MKIHSVILTAISFLLSVIDSGSAEYQVNYSLNKDSKMIVVLDAGHGGHDQGCSGSHSIEKDLALKMTLAFGKKIEAHYNDVELIYTRKKDVFVALNKRAEIANGAAADLFISIHCNAINNKSVSGTETFVMGLHKSEENLNVAKRENQSILLEEDFVKTYNGYDPNSAAGHIMLSMFQNSYLQESIEFASMIERQFETKSFIRSRGVKQAGFVVLKLTTMPSVLVETGFLTNSKDQDLLKSQAGQVEIVDAMFAAFAEYKQNWENRRAAGLNIKPGISIPLVNQETKPQPTKSQKSVEAPIAKEEMHTHSAKAEKNEEKKPIFKIQIAATSKEIALDDKIWKGMETISVLKEGELYKYFVGNFASETAAAQKKNELNQNGFSGAFLVAYMGQEKIKLNEARKMTAIN